MKRVCGAIFIVKHKLIPWYHESIPNKRNQEHLYLGKFGLWENHSRWSDALRGWSYKTSRKCGIRKHSERLFPGWEGVWLLGIFDRFQCWMAGQKVEFHWLSGFRRFYRWCSFCSECDRHGADGIECPVWRGSRHNQPVSVYRTIS